eukprot:TRINITY_DN22397_c0_g1_i2.p1 TRINITY_DN22397_c0_g1~~TRINITY_DN22397_c0_g1_i2.p1  ORF type:complete len:386 (-),score=113.33 TRINITY_DN22397_c0_g1_i2:89-1246(-)
MMSSRRQGRPSESVSLLLFRIVRQQIILPQVWAMETRLIGTAIGYSKEKLQDYIDMYMADANLSFWYAEADRIVHERSGVWTKLKTPSLEVALRKKNEPPAEAKSASPPRGSQNQGLKKKASQASSLLGRRRSVYVEYLESAQHRRVDFSGMKVPQLPNSCVQVLDATNCDTASPSPPWSRSASGATASPLETPQRDRAVANQNGAAKEEERGDSSPKHKRRTRKTFTQAALNDQQGAPTTPQRGQAAGSAAGASSAATAAKADERKTRFDDEEQAAMHAAMRLLDAYRLTPQQRDALAGHLIRTNVEAWWQAYKIYKANKEQSMDTWKAWLKELVFAKQFEHISGRPEPPQVLQYPAEMSKVNDSTLRYLLLQELRQGKFADIL